MPTVGLAKIHNRLIDYAVEKVNAAQTELQNQVNLILEDIRVPPGVQVDLNQIIRTRMVHWPDPKPVPKPEPEPVPEPEIEVMKEG